MLFFDIRVIHPHASSYQNTELPRLYRQHERAKKSKYARRVAEIEHGCFTPLVFTTSGGMAPEATTFFHRLAGQESEKRGSSYSATMNWIRCCLLPVFFLFSDLLFSAFEFEAVGPLSALSATQLAMLCSSKTLSCQKQKANSKSFPVICFWQLSVFDNTFMLRTTKL